MKSIVVSLLLLSTILSSCIKDECTQTVTFDSYVPTLTSEATWRNETEFAALTVVESPEYCQPDGFYVYGDYLFTLEGSTGLHIFDNRDNNAPKRIAFVAIPGAHGIAVRNDVLYISQYVDLLAFGLNQPATPKFLHRTEDVFAMNGLFAYELAYSGDYQFEYLSGTETRQVSCDDPRFDRGGFWERGMFFSPTNGDFIALNASSNENFGDRVGQGGSLARFTISKSSLYVVDDQRLITFSLGDPARPTLEGSTNLGWGIETIFPYKDQLYIGSTTGVHIYDVTDPKTPKRLSTFEHVLSCDPVVVQNDLAYVTMWGGSSCGNQTDQLIVLDVSNPSKPRELQTLPLPMSHGLGVAGDRLFLCSGEEGMRVFDLTDKGLVGKLIAQEKGFDAKDVIVRSDRKELIVFGWYQAGIRQYDYREDGSMSAVSDLDLCE